MLDELDATFLDTEAEEMVIGSDARRRVRRTTRFPYRTICKLEIGRGGVCTGTLIAENKVLTAAHCLRGVRAQSVRVIPGKRAVGQTASAEPFGSTRATRIDMDRRFRRAGDPFDYSVLTLQSPIGRRVGTWSRLRVMSSRQLLRRTMHTAGFPADRHARASHMYAASGRIVLAHEARVEYLADTFNGQSGSPVWIPVAGRPTIIGVHADKDDPRSLIVANIGVRITPQILTKIRGWVSA